MLDYLLLVPTSEALVCLSTTLLLSAAVYGASRKKLMSEWGQS